MALAAFVALAIRATLPAVFLVLLRDLLAGVTRMLPHRVARIRSAAPSPPPYPRSLRSPLLPVSPSDGHPYAPQLGGVVPRDRTGRYVVSGTVNGVDVEFLIDTGISAAAIPLCSPSGSTFPLASRCRLRP